jgi:hypothetical protein
MMTFLSQVSFDDLMCSFISCILLREIMIVVLPDRIAGPGGWLIDTGENEF